jgi:hypothetical protein
MQKDKKIKGFSQMPQRPKITYVENGTVKHGAIPREKSKAIAWLDLNLAYWCNARGLELKCAATGGELQFDPVRKWRWDYAIPAEKIAIEFNGGMFMDKSGHSSVSGLLRDSEKQNAGVAQEWRVIVLTSLNYMTVLKTLNELIK